MTGITQTAVSKENSCFFGVTTYQWHQVTIDFLENCFVLLWRISEALVPFNESQRFVGMLMKRFSNLEALKSCHGLFRLRFRDCRLRGFRR